MRFLENKRRPYWLRKYDGDKYFTNPLDIPNPKVQEIPENVLNDMFQLVKTYYGENVYSNAKMGEVDPEDVYVLQTVSFKNKVKDIEEVVSKFNKPSLVMNESHISVYMPPIVEIWNKEKLVDKVDEQRFKSMPNEVYILIDGVHRTKYHYEQGDKSIAVVFAYQKEGELPARIFGKISDVEEIERYIPTGKTLNGKTKFIDLDASRFRKYNEVGFGKFDKSKIIV